MDSPSSTGRSQYPPIRRNTTAGLDYGTVNKHCSPIQENHIWIYNRTGGSLDITPAAWTRAGATEGGGRRHALGRESFENRLPSQESSRF